MGSSSKHKTIDLNRCKIEITDDSYGPWKQYTVVFLFYSDVSPGGKHCIAKFRLSTVHRRRTKSIMFNKSFSINFISSKFNYVKKYALVEPELRSWYTDWIPIKDNDDYLTGFIALKDFLL